MKTIAYTKYSGAGNTFLLINNLSKTLSFENKQWICTICASQVSDGLISLEESSQSDFRMRIFNCDGSEAAMCGNGLCCLVKFLADSGIERKEYCIEAGISPHRFSYQAFLEKEKVTLFFKTPKEFFWNRPFDYNGKVIHGHFLDSGVPHLVFFLDEIASLDVDTLGRKWRYHPCAPEGTNVDFVRITPNHHLHVRTYERGVEKETLACGTGVIASAYAAKKIFSLPSPLRVKVHSQEELVIDFLPHSLSLQESVTTLSQGELSLKSLNRL